MKRPSNEKSTASKNTLRLWTYTEAQAAIPYLASLMRSLREHRLEAQRLRLEAQRLAAKPGRPDRAALLIHQEAIRAASDAEGRFQEALEELQALDIYCFDAIRGQALVPFVQNKQLAWFIYDLFDSEPLLFWRYHSDPLDRRRPVSEAKEETTMVV